MPYFTIELNNIFVGLADKLIRFSTLYQLGKALSYTYVHTPFRCPRSYLLSPGDRIIKLFMGDKLYNSLTEFIGFNQHDLKIDDKRFLNQTVVKICLEDLLDDASINNLATLKEKIEAKGQESESTIFTFLTSPNFHRDDIRAKVNSLLQGTGISDADVRNLVTQKYWKAREVWPISVPFDDQKIKLLIHIRRGDRTCIQLKDKTICLHGNKIAIVDNSECIFSSSETVLGKNFQRPVEMMTIETILDQIFSRYGMHLFSVIVVSDGYDRAFREIKTAVAQKKIALSRSDLQQIATLQRTCDQEFSNLFSHPNISVILGETKYKLFQSIQAIASADLVIKTTGGFASVLHRYFRRSEMPPMILDASQFDEQALEKFLSLIEQRFINPILVAT